MAKKIKTYIKLTLPAGSATAAPPVGTALGPHGLPIMDFVKAFNERTADQTGNILPTVITVYEDRTFSFITKKPPIAEMIKKAANLQKGAQKPGWEKVGKINLDQAKQIAEAKMPDLNTKNVDQAVKIVEGVAKSMGVEVTK